MIITQLYMVDLTNTHQTKVVIIQSEEEDIAVHIMEVDLEIVHL